MRIALADDHALFRTGLRSTLIEAFGDGVEVAEAKDFDELTDLLAGGRAFELILCDLRMPGLNPETSVREVTAKYPDTPLVMISASEEPADAWRSIEQGAKGYILKSESLAILQCAMELVLAGGVYAPAIMLCDRRTAPQTGAAGSARDPVPQLSTRQRMIFECLVDGKPNKVIARELGIAEGTVKAQLRAVFRKLGVQNRTQAALYAAEVLGRGGAGAGSGAAQIAKAQCVQPGLSVVGAGPVALQSAKISNLKVVTLRD